MRLLAVVCGLAWATFVQENGIRDYKDARVELLREERRAGPSPRREARVCLTIVDVDIDFSSFSGFALG